MLLVPSSLQVWRQSADMNHYYLRSKVPLDPVDHVVEPSDDSVTFLYSEPGGTPDLLTFAGPGRIDQTVLTSFLSVAGQLLPP
jgi:hypothetical protein